MPVVRSHSFRGVDSPHRDPFSPALSRQKSVPTTPTRRVKQNAENLPPNTAPALLKADGSLKSPGLPPRPPSAKPSPSANRVHGNQETNGNARRKLSWDVQNNPNVLQEHISSVSPQVSENNTSDTGVQVMVRIRPLNKKEQDEEAERIIIKTSPNTFSMSDQHYTFDAVAGEDASQEQIFQTMGMPMVENCLQGFNSSIFAYGQTGSGKTYTMWGTIGDPSNGFAPKEERGLTPRVFEKLFARIKQEEKKHHTKQLRYQCRCSFLEIYNEQIMDLLQPSLKNLQIREDTKTGVYVDNLTEEYVSNIEDVSRLLLKGMLNRRVGSTSMNAESSRSHCVFTCIIECRYKSMPDGMSSVRSSRINLVDLAGSERQKQTAAAGERLKEAGSINRSLSQLGNLINILAEVAQTGKQRHIPYRDSRLTFLLQESLGGNAKLAMVCAISPANSCKSETQSTLRFAQRAKAIRNKAVVNEETTTDANLLREQIRQLKEELMRMKSKEIQQTGTVGAYSNAWNARRSYNLLRFSLNHSVAPPTVDSDTEEDMEIDDDVAATQASDNTSVGVEKGIEVHSKSPSIGEAQINEAQKAGLSVESHSESLNKIQTSTTKEMEIDDEVNVIQTSNNKSVGVKKGMEVHLESPSIRQAGLSVESHPECLKEIQTSTTKEMDIDDDDIDVTQTPNNKSVGVMKGFEVHFQCPSIEGAQSIEQEAGLSAESYPKKIHAELEACEDVTQTSNNKSVGGKKDIEVHLESIGGAQIMEAGLSAESHPKEIHAEIEACENVTQTSNNKSVGGKKDIEVHLESIGGPQIIEAQEAGLSAEAHPLKEIYAEVEAELACGASGDNRENVTQTSNNKSVWGKKEIEETPIEEAQIVEAQEAGLSAESHPVCPKEINAEIQAELAKPVGAQEARPECLKEIHEETEAELACGPSGDTCENVTYELVSDDSRAEQLRDTEFIKMEEDEGKTKEKRKRDGDSCEDVIDELVSSDRGDEQLRDPEFIRMEEDEGKTAWKRKRDGDTCENVTDELVFSDRRDEQLRDPEFIEMEDDEGKTEVKKKRDDDEAREWAEREEEWVALFEELRGEAKAYKRQATKRQRELEKERQHSEEMKEALYVAMDGHARLLEQYAELQEKHVSLLAKHRKIREGVCDVKRMASKAGVRASQSKWLEAQAAQIVALNLERDQERQAANEEIEGLRAQLRDTAEAVQAAGELLVRLKEAEEAVSISQDTAALAEQEADAMRREIEKMKRRHATEIATLQQRLLEARLKKASACPMCVMAERVKFEFTEVDAETAQADLEAEEEAIARAAISAAQPDPTNTSMWGVEHHECQPQQNDGMQECYMEMENDTCNLGCEGSFYE